MGPVAKPPSLRDTLVSHSLADFMPVGPTGPLIFERDYHHLPVDTGATGRFFVDIRKYRNNEMNDDPKHETRTAERECYFPLMAKIRKAAESDGLESNPKHTVVSFQRNPDEIPSNATSLSDQFEFVSKQAMYDACTGKGSPLEISTALRLAVRFGMVGASTKALQDYCDKYLGLDCSGFVCNYANAYLGKKYDKANKGATTFRNPESARRGRRLDVKPLDVLAWASKNHVAIIHSINMDAMAIDIAMKSNTDLTKLEFTVVESNSSKALNNSVYRVKSVDAQKVFTVLRPDDTEHKVYILPLP